MCPPLPLEHVHQPAEAGYLGAMGCDFVRQAGEVIEVIVFEIIEERDFLVLLALLARSLSQMCGQCGRRASCDRLH